MRKTYEDTHKDAKFVKAMFHVSEMDWTNKNIHPSKVVSLGDEVDVMVLEIDEDRRRISLGMKQLQEDPWEIVAAKYPLESVHKGIVTNITDYGAFVELEDGIEGLVHVSEMSWTKKNVHPGQIISTSEEVEVMEDKPIQTSSSIANSRSRQCKPTLKKCPVIIEKCLTLPPSSQFVFSKSGENSPSLNSSLSSLSSVCAKVDLENGLNDSDFDSKSHIVKYPLSIQKTTENKRPAITN